MRHFVCSVRDLKAECYTQPFCVPAAGVAVRGFTDQVNHKPEDGQRNDLFYHSADFALFHVGFYDDSTARFENLEVPNLLVEGSSVRS